MGIRRRVRVSGLIAFEAEVRVRNLAPQRSTFDNEEKAKAWIGEVQKAIQKTQALAATKKLAEKSKLGGLRNYERAKLANVMIAYCDSLKSSERCKQSLRPAAAFVQNVTVGGANEDWLEKYVSRMRSTNTRRNKPYTYATLHSQIVYMVIALKWWAKQNNVRDPDICLSTKKFPSGWDVRRDRRLEGGEHELILEQIQTLKVGRDQWRCLYELALETGARLQELALSEWRELERDDQLWRIPAGHTKKRKERRVPLSAKAKEIVAELRMSRDALQPRLFHQLRAPNYISGQFAEFIKSANLVNLKFHDLRHEAISRMCINRSNVPIKTIMEIVGHETYETFSRYSHARDDELIGLFN